MQFLFSNWCIEFLIEIFNLKIITSQPLQCFIFFHDIHQDTFQAISLQKCGNHNWFMVSMHNALSLDSFMIFPHSECNVDVLSDAIIIYVHFLAVSQTCNDLIISAMFLSSFSIMWNTPFVCVNFTSGLINDIIQKNFNCKFILIHIHLNYVERACRI